MSKGSHLAFARVATVRKFQKKLATNIINICSIACGVIAASPIPCDDLPVLTAIQAAMIVTIAYISGRELSFQTVPEFLTALYKSHNRVTFSPVNLTVWRGILQCQGEVVNYRINTK